MPASDSSASPDEAVQPSVETRLAELENVMKRPNSHWLDRVEKLAPAVATLMSGALVALIGYWLSGAVTLSLQRQQVQLANVKEMRDQLQTLVLGDEKTASGDGRVAAAFTLSAYGAPAIAPLLSALIYEDLHSHGDGRREAMVDALRSIGLSDAAAVCTPIPNVLDDRSQRYSWETHLSLIELAGDLRCTNAVDAIQRYLTIVNSVKNQDELPKYKSAVSQKPPVDMSSIAKLKNALTRTSGIVARP